MPAPTIYDVAQRAGVSSATVSRVLNNHPLVKPETRDRVMQAIKELDYQVNLLAAALMTKQTRTIGLIVPDIANPFFAEIARGVEEAGAAAGFNVVMCNTLEQAEREGRYIQVLRQKHVDGIIFTSAYLDDRSLTPLIEAGFPVVLISREVEDVAVDSVRTDDFEGGYQATRHLLGLGHRRIALLAGPLRTKPSLDRKKGYEAALERAQIPLDPGLLLSGEFSIESGKAMAQHLLQSTRDFTAIVAGNDLIAAGAIKICRQHGLSVPTDVSVVGYDRTILAELIEPELTSVAQQMHEMGRQAMELLLQRIQGTQTREPVQVVLPPRLVVAGSTAPPR
ncbi:MAG TPA: LacI family DNA-binding transcriptional regulator [Symbiobacteriaceae bacterium]|nr:LacI family DNA-binding transcriptional regulator [Symbiobacteriaceae bacterium]